MRPGVWGALGMVWAWLAAGPAWADSIMVVDDSYAYDTDASTYDSDADVVVAKGFDVDTGPFWVALQCHSNVMWRMNKITGDWRARETLPDYMKTFHDVVCAGRGSMRYFAFRVSDFPVRN